MLINMISGELQAFGDMMADYKPSQSLCQRLKVYFILEPWHDFWSALWAQVTFKAPQNIRILKDAVKMTCAFLSACAFNLQIWIPEGGLYYFGLTTLLGIPVEEEAITICVCRMAGNTLGCALGYLALHNVKNMAELIACTMSFAAFCRMLQNHPVVGHTFFCGSVTSLAGTAASLATFELLTRIVAGIYAVGGFMLCCMLVFPTSPAKVLWDYRMKLMKVMSDLLDDIATTVQMSLDRDPSSSAGGGGALFGNSSGTPLSLSAAVAAIHPVHPLSAFTPPAAPSTRSTHRLPSEVSVLQLRALTHVSHVSRMQARLHNILYECYVLISEIARGYSSAMTAEDYDALREERRRRLKAAGAATATAATAVTNNGSNGPTTVTVEGGGRKAPQAAPIKNITNEVSANTGGGGAHRRRRGPQWPCRPQ